MHQPVRGWSGEMDKSGNRLGRSQKVAPYDGDLELSRRLRECSAVIDVKQLRLLAELCVTQPNGLRHFLCELLGGVRSTDEADVAALLECALGLWNEIVRGRNQVKKLN